ncbi:MAG: hypothetical protein K2K84_01860, partial [Muribaculaceae bacterium]|nr:hypothetical protein [Muribaculaceae bacterium]
MKSYSYIKVPVLAIITAIAYSCGSSNENDEILTDYAETFNNQATQLMPLTPAIEKFNARVVKDTFYIDVTMDTTVVKPSSLNESAVKTMLKESFTTRESGDLGFAETLEATGVKLHYRCLAGDSTLINLVIDASE